MSVAGALTARNEPILVASPSSLRRRWLRIALFSVAALQAACRADSQRAATNGTQSGDSTVASVPRPNVPAPATAEPPGTETAAAPASASAADSASLVVRGRHLFNTKRCERCHTIGQGDKDGPDLAGVTERRSFKQISALLSDTEEAIQTDPDFQQLRIEHFKDMPNFQLSRADALALYYYLRAATLRARP